jgi:hypothetical protein
MPKTHTDTPAHIDPYAGQAGTFIIDPLTGTRIPIEDYQPVEPIQVTRKPEKTTPLLEDKS